MSAGTTLAGLMISTTQGPAWHGPALTELLGGITTEEALAHPIEGVHSIWELVNHINLWQRYARAILRDEEVSFLDRNNDWPEPEGGDDAWAQASRDVETLSGEIQGIASKLDDAALSAKVPGTDYKLKVLLHGVVTHNIYHAGQIAIVKKCLGKET